MTKYIDAMTARKLFGTMLDEVYYQNKFMVIKRANKPMVAVIPFEVLQSIQSYDSKLNDKIKVISKRNKLGYGEAMKLAKEAKKYSRG